MPRIPYKPSDIAEPRELVEAIRARRGGKLLDLDRMLLHSPPLAAGWNSFLRAVRTELTVPSKLRELAVCVVAVLNRADYEFDQHAPEFLKAGGTKTQREAIRGLGGDGADLSVFDAAEYAVIQLAIEMTRDVEVADATFARVRSVLNGRQVVELVGVIGAYNLVSRFLVALKIEAE